MKNGGDGAMNFKVFNRWGLKVYEHEAKEVRWDGRTNAGVELEAGTYYYILDINLENNKLQTQQSGYITLIRE